jgi:hypothetical protein
MHAVPFSPLLANRIQQLTAVVPANPILMNSGAMGCKFKALREANGECQCFILTFTLHLNTMMHRLALCI